MSYPPPPAYPQYPYGAGPPQGPPPGPVRLRGRVPRLLGWIFLALAVVLFVVGGVVLATKSLGKVNGFQRVSIAQGGGTVTLNGTGKWVGYYEASDVSESISRIPNFRIAVLGPDGQPVQLQRYGNRSDGKVTKLTYDYNGHKGAAAVQFDVTRPGTYRVELEAVDSLPPGADVAFGRDIEAGTVAGAILIVLGILALIAAIVLIIVGYVKRGRHKRELQSGYYGGPPPGYYGGLPPGYQSPPPPPPASPGAQQSGWSI